MGGQVPRRCRVRLLPPLASPSQIIPAAASTRDPFTIVAMSGQHRTITSDDHVSDDRPTDPTTAPTDPTTAPIEPTMAPIESTMAPIEPTTH